MLYPLADIFGWFALAGGSPRFVHRDANGRDRRAIHAGETNQVAMRIGDGNGRGLLHRVGFFNNKINCSLRVGVVECSKGSHVSKDMTGGGDRTGLPQKLMLAIAGQHLEPPNQIFRTGNNIPAQRIF